MDRSWVIRVAAADDMPKVAALFREYADTLGVDLAFQGFGKELESLPGAYGPPGGALLLAISDDGDAVACVGVRKLQGTDVCEMKRLYTRPATRGSGLGRAMAVAAIEAAMQAGYRIMRLDTLPAMTAAQGLYRSLGFETTAPYYDTPVAGTIFMQKILVPRR